MGITEFSSDPQTYISWVLIVAFSICVHEWAHAAMALRCGDDTAAEAGHLTLNPLVQMGPFSIVVLLIIGIAWGAVPVNPALFRKKFHNALVAFAGPLSNLLISLVLGLVYVILAKVGDNPAERFFLLGCIANGVLFFFNMLPVPMFDGWAILSLWVPAMQRVSVEQARTIGGVFLMMVFLTDVGTVVWKSGQRVGELIITFWLMVF